MNYLWDNLFRRSSKERNIIHQLKENVLFADLNMSELTLVSKVVNLRSYRTGETVFRQGEAGVGMYLISRGQVHVSVEELLPATGELRTTPVTQLKEGDFFGDLALVEENSHRSATAIASSEAELIGFFRPALLEIADRNPTAGVKILLRLGQVLGTRLRETTDRITELKRELNQT